MFFQGFSGLGSGSRTRATRDPVTFIRSARSNLTTKKASLFPMSFAEALRSPERDAKRGARCALFLHVSSFVKFLRFRRSDCYAEKQIL